jgi:hypothetical protein
VTFDAPGACRTLTVRDTGASAVATRAVTVNAAADGRTRS